MDPVAIGKKIKQAYPQYAKVDDATLGNKYLQKYGGAISSVQSGQIDIKDIPEKQRVGVGLGLEAIGYKPEEKLTAAQEKTEQAKSNADRILTQLEDLYYGGAGEEGDLAKGRIGGISSSLVAAFGQNAELVAYKDLLKSIRPTLAKAAGDAGNLALQEQIMAGKVIPTAFSTPQEAALKFKTVRARFDLPERELGEVQGPLKNQLELSAPNLMKLIGTVKNYPQILQQTGQEIREGGPLAKPSGQLEQLVGGNVLQRTQMAQGAAGEVATPLLLAGLLKRGGAGLLSKISPKPPTLAPKVLQEGLGLAERGASIRNTAIKRAEQIGETVDGTNLANQVKEWGRKAIATGQDSKVVNQKVKTAVAQFDKKVFTPSEAKSLWDAASQGYTDSSKAGKTILASFQRALRNALRSELETVAPGFEKGTSTIARGLQKEKILKSVRDSLQKAGIKEGLQPTETEAGKFLKGTAKTAAGAGAALILYKLLGLGGGGNYYGAGE